MFLLKNPSFCSRKERFRNALGWQLTIWHKNISVVISSDHCGALLVGTLNQVVSKRKYQYFFVYKYGKFFSIINVLVVSLNDVIYSRTLDRKSNFHILNLVG